MSRVVPISLVSLLAVAASCESLDSTPEFYVQSLRPNLYYVIELAYNVHTATVFFTTAKSRTPLVAENIRVISWANEGGNIYDDTLGDVTLDSPADAGSFLRWSGLVAPPYDSDFDKIGIELRTLLDMVAYDPVPQTGAYAEVDFMGAGIVGYGEWIEAILQLWVQCRGVVGQQIPCHGLHYVVAPEIFIGFMPRRVQENMANINDTTELTHFASPHLYLGLAPDGWRYRAPAPGEYSRWQPLEAYPTYGPFASAEEAARDAAATLDLRPGMWQHMAETIGLDSQLGRAFTTLHTLLSDELRQR